MKKKAEWEIENKKPGKDWPHGNIKFINYSLKYREELDYVLNNLNIEIKSGEKVFLILTDFDYPLLFYFYN
jgi:ATP-binding cassette subfamily C (CFTR/MRP) protein 1